MPIRGSPNGAVHTRPQPGRDRSQQVVAIDRNQWSWSAGARSLSRPPRSFLPCVLISGVAGTRPATTVRSVIRNDRIRRSTLLEGARAARRSTVAEFNESGFPHRWPALLPGSNRHFPICSDC